MPVSTSDRVAIEELISMHGHLTDDGELDRYDELFTDDVVYDVADFGLGELRGIAAVRDAGWALGDANPVGHHVTNIVMEDRGDGVVTARSKGIGVMADGTTGSLTYEDQLERRHGRWRIRRRKVIRRRRPLGA
jgi:hypothetical protein